LVDDRPDFLLQFLRLMGLRYKSTLDRMDGAVLDPLPVRLARKLLEAHTLENPHARQGVSVALDVSQEGLGHMLGVSRQSVNKVLKQWEGLGVLQVSYRGILLLDLKALKRLALHAL
jgi:CRP-like cAMP-binding protein